MSPVARPVATATICPHEVGEERRGDIIAQIFIFCKHARNKWAINYKLCLFVSVFYLDWPLIFPRKMAETKKCGEEILVIPGRAGFVLVYYCY